LAGQIGGRTAADFGQKRPKNIFLKMKSMCFYMKTAFSQQFSSKILRILNVKVGRFSLHWIIHRVKTWFLKTQNFFIVWTIFFLQNLQTTRSGTWQQWPTYPSLSINWMKRHLTHKGTDFPTPERFYKVLRVSQGWILLLFWRFLFYFHSQLFSYLGGTLPISLSSQSSLIFN
jgi:hypothetical protein